MKSEKTETLLILQPICKGNKMRLTIFDNPQIPILWQNSLNKLITPYNYDDLLKLGDVHLAVFNDGVVGISITYQNTIRFIKVRDITRRRGVGRYLIQQTEKFIQSNVYNSVILTPICEIEDNSILELFLYNSGYQKLGNDPSYFEKSLNK